MKLSRTDAINFQVLNRFSLDKDKQLKLVSPSIATDKILQSYWESISFCGVYSRGKVFHAVQFTTAPLHHRWELYCRAQVYQENATLEDLLEAFKMPQASFNPLPQWFIV